MTRTKLVGDGAPVGIRQEQREVIPTLDFVGRVAGELLGEWAEVDDGVIGAKDDDHALGGLDQVTKGGLASFLGEGELLPLDDPAQAGAQHVGIERLQDVVGRTLAQSGDRALQVGVAGHDDDRGVGVGGLELGHELLGGRVGQPAVEDDGREPAQIGLLERLGRASHRRDPVVVELEDVAQIGPRVGDRPRSPGFRRAASRPGRSLTRSLRLLSRAARASFPNVSIKSGI